MTRVATIATFIIIIICLAHATAILGQCVCAFVYFKPYYNARITLQTIVIIFVAAFFRYVFLRCLYVCN